MHTHRTLVGHSLQYDLKVLLLSHPHKAIRDTVRHECVGQYVYVCMYVCMYVCAYYVFVCVQHI